MKRFIFAIFTLANVISVNGDNIFGHRNETWINQTSINNLATVSKIHKDVFLDIPTDSLLKTCLSYPNLLDFIYYDNIIYGFDRVFYEYNGFEELFHRDDLVETVLKELEQLPSKVAKLNNANKIDRGLCSLTYLFLEYMICRKDFASQLSAKQKNDLVNIISNNILLMNTQKQMFGGMHLKNIRADRTLDADFLLSDFSFQKTYINNIFTPNGTFVPAYQLNDDDFSPDEIAVIYAKQKGDHPNADSVNVATRSYNCHGYAWYMSNNSNSSPLIIENIYPVASTAYDIYYTNDESYELCSLSDAEIVVYFSNNGEPIHSARKLTNSTFRSKWGLGFMFDHSLNDTNYGTNVAYYKRATPSVIGDTRPCSSTYRVYSLHNDANVSWSFSGGTSSSLIAQNSPSTNRCTISNSSHTYIKDNLVATVSRSGASTYTVSKALDTGINFSGSYTGVFTGMAPAGVTYPPISSTSISSGNTYPVTGGYTLTLTSSYFQNATVSYTGSAVNTWTNTGNGTITMKLNNVWTTSTVTITGYKGCDVYQIKFFVFPNMTALGVPQLIVESDGQTCEVMMAFESEGKLVKASELNNSSELEWDLTIANVKTGKIVYDGHLVGPEVKLDTSDWEPGIYAFRAKIGDEVVTQKVTIGKNK